MFAIVLLAEAATVIWFTAFCTMLASMDGDRSAAAPRQDAVSRAFGRASKWAIVAGISAVVVLSTVAVI